MSGRAAPSGPLARLPLADSDLSLRTVLHLALQTHGYQVALADAADTALEMAGHEHPDLIVLDLSLVGVVDVIHALRRAGATPILLLTWPTEPDPRAALDAGADALTSRPASASSWNASNASRHCRPMRTPRPPPPACSRLTRPRGTRSP